jgi:hypothetical protein
MRTSDLSLRVSSLSAGIALLALALSGCGRTAAPVSPAAGREPESALRAGIAGAGGLAQGGHSANLFYPLDLGNHWGYDHALGLYTIPIGGPPGPVFGLNDRHNFDIVCIEQLAGRSYFIERESFPGGVSIWSRIRQDGAGLYEADVAVTLPPTCAAEAGRQKLDAEGMSTRAGEAAWAGVAARLADPAKQAAYRAAWERIQTRAAEVRRALGVEPGLPRAAAGGGVEPGEITRLEYPLHPGAHWVIRADPRFESIVEAAEVLDLAVGHVAGWRIRIETEFLGPDDRVHVWYGRSGLLKLEAHFEGVATDPDGNPIGRVISDESDVLTDLSLSGGRFAAR